MIRSLTGKNGATVSRLAGDTWIVGGESARIAALESQVASLASALAAIRAAPNLSGSIEALRNMFEDVQRINSTRLEDLEANEVGHGTALIDFGAFPGFTEISATVSDANIIATDTVLIWPAMVDTVDHTASEHAMEEFCCNVESVTAGSFVVLVHPRVGLSFGVYQFNYLYL